jgi:type I restriction enzyme S subunit
MNNSRKVDSILTYYGKGVTPKYVEASPIIVLNQKCIRHNKIDYSFAQYIDDKKKYNEDKFLRVGDILINSTGQGTAGRVAFVEKLPQNKKVIIDSHILVIRTNDYYESKCLNYSLFSIEKQLQTFMDGSTGQGEFDKLRLFNVVVNYSQKYSVQKEIANILSDIDNKIDLNNQINDNLERMAKTLYDYWFVQFDFPDENGKPYKSSGGKMIWNETLKREIPEGWEARKLVEIANITMGQSPNGESFNELQEGMIFFQGSTDFGWRYPENRIFTNSPTRYASEDDILLSVRAPIGAINIALSNCCIGRGLAAINSKEGFNSFLIYQMNYFKKKFDYLNSVGTTFGSLTKDELYNLELACPQTSMLQKFEAKVQIFDKKIKKNTKQNQQLTSLRDWLLPMLMNGQVKVE